MELVFCCEAVFLRYNNEYYSPHAPFNMEHWKRYLKVFDNIIIIARVENSSHPTEYKLDSNKISFYPLKRYKGLVGALNANYYLKKKLSKIAVPNRAYILRLPGQIGSVFSNILKKRNIPYGVEVVGDPWDVFSSIKTGFSFVLKSLAKKMLQKSVINASVSLYVTKRQLQERYPSAEGIRTFSASNVYIPPESYSIIPKRHPGIDHLWKFMAVGSLHQLYKSPDIVIDAMTLLKNKNISFQLDWFGGGKYEDKLKLMSNLNGLHDCVKFHGDVNRGTIDQYLTENDIFIHVSRTEGLPRAIIEAMAKGLPVVGSNVGGIPELLSKDQLIPPNDADAVASLCLKYIHDAEYYNIQAEKNLINSKLYSNDVLMSVREEFYKEILRICGNR